MSDQTLQVLLKVNFYVLTAKKKVENFIYIEINYSIYTITFTSLWFSIACGLFHQMIHNVKI